MTQDLLAAAAVKDIVSGMAVGLGTGRAATRAIRALAQRAATERLVLRCVATSQASHDLAATLGLTVGSLEEIGPLDFLFDGADEVDPELRMIKGRGGAMTREKIVAHASAQRMYLIQSSKLSSRLGEKAPLPIEVLASDLAAVRQTLRTIGLEGPIRLKADGTPYKTDNGNPVIDAPLPSDLDVVQLGACLDKLSGVVGHGLFLTEANDVLIEDADGKVSRRTRAQ
ncbi:MAG: ribose 5-phosphate isomerase [Rhodospirillaceae bacterium]|jgi:ribose 5-phosphate isomerase A|nr:ribose 5-phosphate isomerase [Rhodospirillaceae bacterium]MEA2959630.1 ribose 5-phosphate isomerase [Alphaproteobacteria bacterium]